MTVGAEHYYSYYYAGMNEGFKNGGESAPFDVPFHLLVNLAVGGNLPGTVITPISPVKWSLTTYVSIVAPMTTTVRGCNSNVNRLLERPGPRGLHRRFCFVHRPADSLSC